MLAVQDRLAPLKFEFRMLGAEVIPATLAVDINVLTTSLALRRRCTANKGCFCRAGGIGPTTIANVHHHQPQHVAYSTPLPRYPRC